MKKHQLIFVLFNICLVLNNCGSSQEINGHTTRTAYRSVKFIKEKLPLDNRVEFEVSFWTIRDAKPKDEEFLDAVDGKDAWEIMEMAKEIYHERKSAGYEGYAQYKTWEEMIAKFDRERMDQEKKKGSTKRDETRKNGSVIYNMRVPNRS